MSFSHFKQLLHGQKNSKILKLDHILKIENTQDKTRSFLYLIIFLKQFTHFESIKLTNTILKISEFSEFISAIKGQENMKELNLYGSIPHNNQSFNDLFNFLKEKTSLHQLNAGYCIFSTMNSMKYILDGIRENEELEGLDLI
eukprot:gene5817-9640_t